MKAKILLFAFLIMLTLPNLLPSQTTGKKTNKDLKKADDVVDKSIVLIGKILKKKDKSKKQQGNTNDTLQNTDNTDPQARTENEVLKAESSKENIQDVPLTKDASILFKNSISKASNTEKNDITSFMNIKATKDGTQFYINDEYSKDYTFTPSVYPLDINHDGIEEIAIVYGHMAISGDNVISTLFIKDKLGHYNANFGFTGSLIFLPNKSKPFSDVALGGPGFTFPVWSWNGKVYAESRTISDKQLEAAKPLFLEEASKRYCDALKN
jgi:hypothetical protein